ncbi:MAG: hypothetical protein RLP14_06405 [Owenweeksia sp.]
MDNATFIKKLILRIQNIRIREQLPAQLFIKTSRSFDKNISEFLVKHQGVFIAIL